MSSPEQNPKNREPLSKIIEERIAKDIGAVIIAPGVPEGQRERLATTLKGKIPVIAVKGASVVDPNVLTKIDTLYEVVDMNTNKMKYFAPEALVRSLNDAFTRVLDRLELRLSPIEGFFKLLNFIVPRGVSGAILTALIAIECLGADLGGKNKDLLVVAGSTRAGDLDTALVIRSSQVKNFFFTSDQPIIKEILAMPPTNR